VCGRQVVLRHCEGGYPRDDVGGVPSSSKRNARKYDFENKAAVYSHSQVLHAAHLHVGVDLRYRSVCNFFGDHKANGKGPRGIRHGIQFPPISGPRTFIRRRDSRRRKEGSIRDVILSREHMCNRNEAMKDFSFCVANVINSSQTLVEKS